MRKTTFRGHALQCAEKNEVGCVLEMAMAGLRMVSLASVGSFCGDGQMRGFARQLGGGFSDRSHELFYALRVRCGKERHLAGRLANVQELVDVQRNLVLLSQKAWTKQGVVCEVIGDLEPEAAILIGISDPNESQLVLDRIMKNLEDLHAEIEFLNVKAMKNNGSSSSSSSSESSDSDMGKKAMDTPALRKRKNSPAIAVAAETSAPENHTNSIPPAHGEPFSQTQTEMVILPLFHSAERKPPQVQEPAIVAPCSTANSAFPATAREIYRKGPTELKDTLSGRVIVDAASSPPPSPGISVFLDVSTRAGIKVCTVGKCKRGGSQQILASLQACVPESSDVSVTSCKCMGKCKSAPNVRVENGEGQTQVHSHVSVDDVDTLVALHLGGPLFARVDYGVAAA